MKATVRFWPLIGLLVALVSVVIACSGSREASRGAVSDVDFRQAMEMLASESPPIVVDVRTPPEFTGELGHIPGARLIPLQTLEDSLGVLRRFKDRKILAVCRSGRRSAIAAKLLAKEGFTHVYNLSGGMLAWNENGGGTE